MAKGKIGVGGIWCPSLCSNRTTRLKPEIPTESNGVERSRNRLNLANCIQTQHRPRIIALRHISTLFMYKVGRIAVQDYRVAMKIKWDQANTSTAQDLPAHSLVKSCPTLHDAMDYSPLGSSVHESFQPRILEWVAISFSRGSSQPRDWTCISCIGRWVPYHWATREVHNAGHAIIKVWWSLAFTIITFWLDGWILFLIVLSGKNETL